MPDASARMPPTHRSAPQYGGRAIHEAEQRFEGLDFKAFCAMVRESEHGEHDELDLRKRFKELDVNGTGRVMKHEYLRAALRDELALNHARVALILEQWDDDGNGEVDLKEFRRAVRSLGFGELQDTVIDAIFLEFDEDKSGSISRLEIDRRLKKYAKLIPEQQFALRKMAGGRRGAALSTTVKLDRSSGRPVSELIRDALAANAVRVIDLFRDWDENGDGLISQKEFYQAMAPLGLDVSREEALELFDQFDPDGSGTIEYKELNMMLRRQVDVREVQRRRAMSAAELATTASCPMSKSIKLTLAAMSALETSGSMPAGAAQQLRRLLELREAGDPRLRRSATWGDAPPPVTKAHPSAYTGKSVGGTCGLPRSNVVKGVMRPAPRLAFATTKPQLLDDLASLWLCSRPNVAHAFASTAPHTVNLLPPRTAQELLPHRHAPTCAATSQTLARLRAVQGTLAPPEPATLEIKAWADRRAEERFAVKAASVAVAAPEPAADSSQAAPGPGCRPRSAPLTRPVANRPTRPSSGSASRRPVSILSQLTPTDQLSTAAAYRATGSINRPASILSQLTPR